MSEFAFSVKSSDQFESTIDRVTEALKTEGFGVLTTIDVSATLKSKLGVTQPPYVILGACNPHFAHQALEAKPEIGALLPCNVVVREEADGGVGVMFMDPMAVLGMVDDPAIADLAKAVAEKLHRVAAAIGS